MGTATIEGTSFRAGSVSDGLAVPSRKRQRRPKAAVADASGSEKPNRRQSKWVRNMPHEPSAESTEGTLDHTTNWPASGPDETIALPVPELSRTEEVTHTPTDDQTDIVGESSATPGASSEALPRRFGAYALLSEVARGGMGVVYKARHQALGRVVALKMILEGRLTSAEAVQRFHQEAPAAAALDHPNIVPVFDIGVQDGRHYFTMAFVEGASLKETVTRDGVPSPAAAAALVRTIAEAIAAAHEAGIVHRDLKPENVLIDRDGRPRVTDFGLAKRDEGDTALTATGQILGTPAYMAPEQANGEVARSGRALTSTASAASCTTSSPAGRRSPAPDRGAHAGRQ